MKLEPPTSPIVIVEAQEHHAKAMSNFMTGLFVERLETLFQRDAALTEQEELEFVQRVAANDRAVIYLALVLDRVVGMLDFHAHPKPQMAHGGEFGVSVAKEYRGRGIARRLIDHLLVWAEARDIKRVELRVFSNNAKAIRIYEHLGFVKEGCQKGAVRINNSFADMVYMTRFL